MFTDRESSHIQQPLPRNNILSSNAASARLYDWLDSFSPDDGGCRILGRKGRITIRAFDLQHTKRRPVIVAEGWEEA
jgi:hypothetical protein